MPDGRAYRMIILAALAAVAVAGCAERRMPAGDPNPTPAPAAPRAEPSTPAPPAPAARYLSVEEAARVIRENPDVFLLCVCTEEEYDRGHIAGSILIPVMGLEIGIERNEWFPEINHGRTPRKDQPILCYCWWKTCVCPSIPTYSQVAARILLRKGYTNVSIIAGGMRDWTKKRLPVEKVPASAAGRPSPGAP